MRRLAHTLDPYRKPWTHTGNAKDEKNAKALIVARGFSLSVDTIETRENKGNLWMVSIDSQGVKHCFVLEKEK